MTNQGLLFAGGVVIAFSFIIYYTDIILQPAAFVKIGDVEVGDVSEGTAARLFIFGVVFTAGIGMITGSFVGKKGSSGRKLKSRMR